MVNKHFPFRFLLDVHMICHRLCSWQPPTPCKAVIPSIMRQHLYWMDLYISLWVVPLLACTIFSSNCYFVICKMVRFIWFHQHPVSVCKLVSADYCFQVKSSFEDRVTATIMEQSCDAAFRISVSEPSFYSIYFAVTLHDSMISFVILVLIIWLSSEKVLWNFPEHRWKFVEDNFHASKPRCISQCRANAEDVGWGGEGVDKHFGSFQYAMAQFWNH